MNINKLRADFPLLTRKIHGRPLVYFDNAATALKPETVIRAETDFYRTVGANAHRGLHTLALEATEQYENVREKIRKFLNAKNTDEIVFTSGATDGLNLLAYTLAKNFLRRGDEVVLSEMEHHSNIVPWQILGKKRGWRIKYIPVTAEGRLDMRMAAQLISRKTKLVSVTHASNVLGTVNPIKEIASLAHRRGAVVVVDAAQSVVHIKIDVKNLDCDFLVFSSHKLFGPTGCGALYGRASLLSKLPPFKSGGQMIESVTKNGTTFAVPPQKFEAGTMPLAQVIGLGAALDYLKKLGWKNIQTAENQLTQYALKKLQAVPGLKLLGTKTANARLPVFSFTLKGAHPHDLATLLDKQGIAVRAGHHCAQILHHSMGIPASTRVSLAFYNTSEEIDLLTKGLKDIGKFFHKST
jgi:cysteine desulfurase/selenocysteine lyase